MSRIKAVRPACIDCGAEVGRASFRLRQKGQKWAERCIACYKKTMDKVKTCAYCGGEFRTKMGGHAKQRYCSIRCGVRARALRERPAFVPHPFRRDRMEMTIDQVYERDRGICHVCHSPVSRAQASRDHIIPWSMGGTGAAANLALAHRACNSRRGAGRIPAQLRLGAPEYPVVEVVACSVCGETFPKDSKVRRYCSTKCSRTASAIMTREKYTPKRRRHAHHKHVAKNIGADFSSSPSFYYSAADHFSRVSVIQEAV